MKHPPAIYDVAEAVWGVAEGNRPVEWLHEAIDAAIEEYNALGVNGLGAKLVFAEQRVRDLEKRIADGWLHPEEVASRIGFLRTVLEGYEAWEASLLNDEAANLLDAMSKGSYETLMKLQRMRNLALGR